MNKVKVNEIKNKLNRIPYLKQVYRKIIKGRDYTIEEEKKLIESAEKIFLGWPDDVEKPIVGLVREYKDKIVEGMYWTKFERFLKNNSVQYEYFDINNSTFIDEAEKFDIIIWRTLSDPASQNEAEGKIKLLEKYMGKSCFPSEEELWFYEDKIRQHYLFRINNLPTINTIVSYSENEAMNFIKGCNYPIVSKIATGSGSQGVRLIRNYKEARKMCKRIFGHGLKIYWPYLRQKNYIYFQEFIEDSTYDLRIIIINDSYFGYYRNVPKGDFRASGAGNFEKKDIPKEALLLAKRVKECLPRTRILAVDLLKNPKDNEYYIIETSLFIRIDTPEQLVVNGVAGRYIYSDNEFRFEKGKFWLQELVLQQILNEWKDGKATLETVK